jgi:hypothetical protein
MKTKASKPAKPAGKAVAMVPDPPDKAKADALADLTLTPGLNAAAVVGVYVEKTFGAQDVGSLARSLTEEMKEVRAGDLKLAEAMLHGQAQALQAIFVNLARRANSQQYLKNWEAYLRIALKAQNQCRMTLETLATLKNPPVVIARQANINNGGQQQVNNAAETVPGRAHFADATAHAANRENGKTGLLEASNGERLDTGTAGAAGRADPHLAPVGRVDRATDTRGQGKGRAQR